MSLINDMLRDLDRRAQLPDGDRRISSLFGVEFDEADNRRRLLPLLLGLCVLAGLGGGYLLFKPDADESTGPLTNQVNEPLAVRALQPLQTNHTGAAATPDAAQLPASLEIAEARQHDSGLALRLRSNAALKYSVEERSERRLVLRVDDVASISNQAARVDGLSVIQMQDHTLVELELERASDFELYTNEVDEGFELLLAAEIRSRTPQDAPLTEAGRVMQEGSAPANHYAEPATRTDGTASHVAQVADAPSDAANSSATAAAATASVAPPRTVERTVTPLRVTRGLTLEQQDRNTSQAAVQALQAGRLLEAYEQLLTFLARNPEAHLSRETLGTILLAQGELRQAAIIADEGLALAPNYAPYKKMKARLLMQEGRAVEALQLLQQVPPSVQVDKEYHELLATLYQQAGDHAKAAATYQDLLRTNAAEGRWWAGLGISLEAQGQLQQALASYQQALQQPSLDISVRQYSQNRLRSLSIQ